MKTAAIAIVFIFAFATTAFATTTDEIGGYTSAVIQESGAVSTNYPKSDSFNLVPTKFQTFKNR